MLTVNEFLAVTLALVAEATLDLSSAAWNKVPGVRGFNSHSGIPI